MLLPEPERDTACFSDKQWFVEGYAFSTKEDAEAAIKLAYKHATTVREEWGARLATLIEESEP